MGDFMSPLCDNCSMNQSAFSLFGGPGKVYLGGPGKVYLEPNDQNVSLVYDYDHIYKNIRNKWITGPSKELSFTFNNVKYVACWNDITKLYNEDKSHPVRLTKIITYIS